MREFQAPKAAAQFVSFDGGVQAGGDLERPDRYRYWDNYTTASYRIPRGAGLSYAAASFREDGLSVEHGAFDRVTDFDSTGNIVEVESGISLYSLHKFLRKRGCYLAVQPGHGRISVGGCIAADVHGKNHARDGTFINQVVSIILFHPNYGMIELSRDVEPQLFKLTCGGYGLTGHIISAKLRAVPIPGPVVRLTAIPFEDVSSGVMGLAQRSQQIDFAYTWHDMRRGRKTVGDGFLFEARFESGDGAGSVAAEPDEPPPLSAKGRQKTRINLLNTLTVSALNTLYRSQQTSYRAGKLIDLQDALFPLHKSQAYFGLFGNKGFHEYQIILPTPAVDQYFRDVLDEIRQRPVPITLASAKAFAGTNELLRFTGDGTCIALNFPRCEGASHLMKFLDEQAISLGGLPNIIKDSRLTRSTVDRCYAGADDFRKARIAFDPKRLFRSELSERLGL